VKDVDSLEEIGVSKLVCSLLIVALSGCAAYEGMVPKDLRVRNASVATVAVRTAVDTGEQDVAFSSRLVQPINLARVHDISVVICE